MHIRRFASFFLLLIVFCFVNARAQDFAQLMQEAKAAQEHREFDKALELYATIIESDSMYVDAYVGRGVSRMLAGNTAEAIVDFSHAIALKPDHARAYFMRGTMEQSTGKMSEAILDYTLALSIDSTLADAYYMRGQAYMDADSIPETVYDMTRALKLDGPKGPRTSRMRNVLSQIGYPALSGATKTFTDSMKTFTIELPKEWTRAADVQPDFSVLAVSHQAITSTLDEYGAGVTITRRIGAPKLSEREQKRAAMTKGKASRDTTTIQQKWAAKIDDIAKTNLLWHVDSTKTITVGGYNGIIRWITMRESTARSVSRIYQAIVARGESVVTIDLRSPAVLFDDYREIFDKALKSVAFVEAQKK